MIKRDWITVTGPMAYCCICDEAYHGDSDPTAHRAMNWARLHVDITGHDVTLERGQSMVIGPDPSFAFPE